MNFNNRIEKKFFIEKSEKKDFIKLIKNYLKLTDNPYDKDYTVIESVYFDSEELYCYQGHYTLQDRFKIRTRRYAPDGDRLDYCFAELKHKNGPITDKKRFQYEGGLSSLQTQLLNGKDNPDLDVFKYYVENYKLEPICKIFYDRVSFENDDIRITIDSEIDTRLLKPIRDDVKVRLKQAPYFVYAELLSKYFNSNEFLIVEIKDEYPTLEHLPKPIQEFLAHKSQNFSKYCYTITKGLLK